MKKSMFASVKPLAMATAVAAGTTVSMIAVALPGGDTSGANGVVTETLCQNAADMTITSGTRSVTTATGACQVRTLPPTKGLVLNESASAGATVTDSSPLVNAGGELYETYVGGVRQGAVLLTPNRALAVTRASSFASGTDGAVSFELGAAVQPSTGLQSEWLTGTYNVMNRVHDFQDPASNLTASAYAAPNPALGERNYTSSQTLTFNGDGTCDLDVDTHHSFTLTKDPMLPYFGEMDNGCTVGNGQCGQNDGDNYVSQGTVNIGSTGSQTDFADWEDQNADGNYGALVPGGCTYVTAPGVVSVTYTVDQYTGGAPNDTPLTWTTDYNVSADLRYLVANEAGTEGHIGGYTGENEGATLAVGVRVGEGDVEGKTYLYNATLSTNSLSTPNTASYESPAQPTYQTEECITRGSIEFVAGGTCNVQSVSSCAGRAMTGYEETVADAADGTITDSLTVADGADTAPTSCTWSNAGGLVVTMGVTDPDGAPISMSYTGDVSDNGEALVLQGIYNITGPSPDAENTPLLPQMQYNILSFVVGQEYQGSLTGDQDADGETNYAEFTWAADNTASGSVRNEFTGDGSSDIFWRRGSDGVTQIWALQNSVRTSILYPGIQNTAYSTMGTGDMNNDGVSDVLYRNLATGQHVVWNMATNGTKTATYPPIVVTAVTYQGMGDFDGDGDSDVLYRDNATGANRIVVMEAGTQQSVSFLPIMATTQSVKGIGDFNGDGVDDILWYRTSDGAGQIWNMAGNARNSVSYLPYNGNLDFGIVAVADTNGDGTSDVVWRNATTGQNKIWEMANSVRQSQPNLPAFATNQSIVATGDYNADGTEDLLWRDAATGANRVWNLVNHAKDSESVLNAIATSYNAAN